MERVTILLAEDEGLLLMEFEDALSEAGFNVIPETNAKKAIDRLRSGDPPIDGLITDILFDGSPGRLGGCADSAGDHPRDTYRLYYRLQQCRLGIERRAEEHQTGKALRGGATDRRALAIA